MKKLALTLVMFWIPTGLAIAGPGKVLTYPFLHSHKTAHALGHAAKVLVW